MRGSFRSLIVTGALAVVGGSPSPAQQAGGVVADLMTDLTELEKKMVDLARAIPADKYGWRPSEGVRSVGEVFLHVAADNYLLPAGVGTAPPEATGIKAAEYASVQRFEGQKLGPAAIVAAMEQSFAHLKGAMAPTQGRIAEKVSMFGQEYTVGQLWILTVTHLHEHLGQAIAYARSNGVVPPWSRGG
jgi:uncharacterized damage-inducible protein DinB